MKSIIRSVAALVIAGWSGAAGAAEFPIGEPIIKNGMRIGALYIQAVKMDMGHGNHAAPPEQTGHGNHGNHGGGRMHHAGSHAEGGDMHLEARVAASADNDWGFGEGAWIPYLRIDWTLTKKGSDWTLSGTFLPMVASDGPHYGDNLMLDGPGKYALTYRVSPPDPTVFPRHFDRETGVSGWWEPFELNWEFVFVGTGRKGGY